MCRTPRKRTQGGDSTGGSPRGLVACRTHQPASGSVRTLASLAIVLGLLRPWVHTPWTSGYRVRRSLPQDRSVRINWWPTAACSQCRGTGILRGIGGRSAGDCATCGGDGGGRHWIGHHEDGLIAIVHGREDHVWRAKLLYPLEHSHGADVPAVRHAVPAARTRIAILRTVWDDGPSARRGVELAFTLMLGASQEEAAACTIRPAGQGHLLLARSRR